MLLPHKPMAELRSRSARPALYLRILGSLSPPQLRAAPWAGLETGTDGYRSAVLREGSALPKATQLGGPSGGGGQGLHLAHYPCGDSGQRRGPTKAPRRLPAPGLHPIAPLQHRVGPGRTQQPMPPPPTPSVKSHSSSLPRRRPGDCRALWRHSAWTRNQSNRPP